MRRDGNPWARMEVARLEFAGPGRRMSQWRKVREEEAMIGGKTSSPSSISGELSWTRVKRSSCFRLRRSFEIAER